MSRWLGMTLLILLVGLACRGQSPDAGTGTSGNAKPAAQAGSTTPSTSATPGTPGTPSAPTTKPAEKKKPKRVWTNDEIGSVKGDVSVVGDGKSENPGGTPRESDNSHDSHAELAKNYRDQIRQLREQIDAADSRIQQLRNFRGENTSPSGGININQGYNMVPLEDQVKQLEEKKKKLQAKIDDIEVDAKKNGIDPGELR